MILYKFTKLKFIGELVIIIMFFSISFSTAYKLSEFSFNHTIEFVIAYIFLLVFFTMFFFFYTYLKALPAYFYTISLEKSSLIYKKAETVIYQFKLSDIEFIAQKQASQVFVFNLKNKEQFFLPFGIDEMELFLNALTNNYHPSAKYNKTIKAKKQGFIVILLISIFFPFLAIPLLLSPYIILFYILAFFLTFMIKPKYIKVLHDKLEITNNLKTLFLNKEDVKSVELEHILIKNSGHSYRCKLSMVDEHTYYLHHYKISNIDLYCLLTHWKMTYNKNEETNNLP